MFFHYFRGSTTKYYILFSTHASVCLVGFGFGLSHPIIYVITIVKKSKMNNMSFHFKFFPHVKYKQITTLGDGNSIQ